MKALTSLTLISLGLLAFSPSADAQARRGRAIPSDGTYDSITRDKLVAEVQRALTRRGYYVALDTGEYVSETRIAVRRYQRDHGLRMSGKIDAALLRSLGIR